MSSSSSAVHSVLLTARRGNGTEEGQPLCAGGVQRRRAGLTRRVEMVMPPLATLLAAPRDHLLRYNDPLLGSVLPNQSLEVRILVLRPRPPQRLGLGPSVRLGLHGAAMQARANEGSEVVEGRWVVKSSFAPLVDWGRGVRGKSAV